MQQERYKQKLVCEHQAMCFAFVKAKACLMKAPPHAKQDDQQSADVMKPPLTFCQDISPFFTTAKWSLFLRWLAKLERPKIDPGYTKAPGIS